MENFKSPTSVSLSRAETSSLSFYAPRPLGIRKDINARSSSLIPAPLRIVKAKPVNPSITPARVRAISSSSGHSSQDFLEGLQNSATIDRNNIDVSPVDYQKPNTHIPALFLVSHIDERKISQNNSSKVKPFSPDTFSPLVVRKQRRDITTIISPKRRSQRDFSSDDCKRVLRLIPSQHFPPSRTTVYATPAYPPTGIPSSISYGTHFYDHENEPEQAKAINASDEAKWRSVSYEGDGYSSESSTIHHPQRIRYPTAENRFYRPSCSEVPGFVNHTLEREKATSSNRVTSHAFERISSTHSQTVRFKNGFEPMKEHRRSKTEPVPVREKAVEPKKSRAASLRGFLCRVFGRGARASSRVRKPSPLTAPAAAAQPARSHREDRKVDSFGQRFLLPPPPPADLVSAIPGPTIRVPKQRSNTVAGTDPASPPANGPGSVRTRASTFPQGADAGLARVQAEFRADGRELEFVDAALWYLGLATLVIPMAKFM